MYNFMAAVVDHSLLFSDAFGGVQRLHLANGTALWSLPALSDDQMSTGGETRAAIETCRVLLGKVEGCPPKKPKAPRNLLIERALGNQMSFFFQLLVAFQVDKSWACNRDSRLAANR